jgi:rfaE bifunctional protein kinase chain/domain
MLDKFIFGSVERISPEAPVPIVLCEKETDTLGGCGNVIRNLSNLDVKTSVISFVGKDFIGEVIKKKLIDLDVDIDGLLFFENVGTTHKMRIIANKQQVVRVDWDAKGLTIADYEKLEKLAVQKIKNIDGVIISDYNKGACSNNFTKSIINKAKKNNIPVFVDPKGKNWSKYAGATCITPNTKEVSDLGDYILKENHDYVLAGKTILKKYGVNQCLITRGKDGMSMISNDEHFHLSSNVKEVFDVSGAGDTVIACLATAIISGVSVIDAVKFANKAAGIVVGHIGTSAITKKELEV